MQGCFSYTVIATTETIVSFRTPDSKLGGTIDKIAHVIHGELAPEATYHGTVGYETPTGKPLMVCTMPKLPGDSLILHSNRDAELSDLALKKQLNFSLHLARYFARAWKNPQPVSEAKLEERRSHILKKLSIIEGLPQFAYLHPHIRQLQSRDGVTLLYSQSYPQVLNHGDINEINTLVDSETFAITGLVDWSTATIAPFGSELSALRKCNGSMDELGWTDFKERAKLEGAFWAEFFAIASIKDPSEQETIKNRAVLATKLEVILTHCFKLDEHGQYLEEVVETPSSYVSAWLTNLSWEHLVLRDDAPGAS
ncbi:hypothetical protein GGR56DRAFT_662920 [Xylariaceae sp. FL0804]|nr:hypothetical protein GGR56DRAFT_662920 [Xylariaceae sp. FL0804]